VNDVSALTFEGLSLTPNAFGSYVEINGDKRGASYSPLPPKVGSNSSSTNSSTASMSIEPLALNTEEISIATDENIEQQQQHGLVSQAIKLLSPPVTPRDYAVLLGVGFL